MGEHCVRESETGLAQKVPYARKTSRKGAKAAKRYRASQGFLCFFAPLREKHFSEDRFMLDESAG